jgi:hypothetical protein
MSMTIARRSHGVDLHCRRHCSSRHRTDQPYRHHDETTDQHRGLRGNLRLTAQFIEATLQPGV